MNRSMNKVEIGELVVMMVLLPVSIFQSVGDETAVALFDTGLRETNHDRRVSGHELLPIHPSQPRRTMPTRSA